MSKTVHKFKLAYFRSTRQEFELSNMAKVVHVECQHPGANEHYVTFWAEIPEDPWPAKRTFAVFPTGGEIPDSAEYVGTAIDDFGLVMHLYEIKEETP